MRGKTAPRLLVLAAVVAAICLAAYAWMDAGRQPVRPITQPVAVPEQAK